MTSSNSLLFFYIRVLDNLKDYTVRAVVNAVDHLGTVAYKLNDILEQQTLDFSSLDFKLSCINQKLLTCQTYTDKEGLRQQQLLAFIPRHHKHYILPNPVNKRVHFSPQIQNDAKGRHLQTKSCIQPSARSLSWHLASETTSTLKGTSHSRSSKKMDDPKFSGKISGVFRLSDEEEIYQVKTAPSQMQLTGVVPALGAAMQMQAMGTASKEISDGYRPLTTFGSFENQYRREVVMHVPIRSKSVLSAFFVKQKVPKLKAGQLQSHE